MHVVFVTRHYNQNRRVSGVISFLRVLNRALRVRGIETSIVYTRNRDQKQSTCNGKDDYSLPVSSSPFYIARHVLKLQPDHIVYISSTSDARVLLWWWVVIAWFLRKQSAFFYQATNMRVAPSLLQQSLLDRYVKTIILSNKTLDSAFSRFKSRTVLRPAVDLCHLSGMRTRCINRNGAFRLLFMGHYTLLKGADTFMALARDSRLSDCFFEMAGGVVKGYEHIYHQAERRAKKQANFKVHGYIESADRVLADCDVLILPYRSGATVLGVAQTAIEAMALGKPVISTPNSAVADLIEGGVNGFICSSIEDIIKHVILLKNDRFLYREVAEKAIKTVECGYDIETRVKKLLEMFDANN